MRPEIAAHLPALSELCLQHRIRELYIFGSAVADGGSQFDPARSDVDFLVDFIDDDLGPWLKKFFEFKRALEALFDRPVDLVMKGAVKKPYAHASVEATKVPVYAAA